MKYFVEDGSGFQAEVDLQDLGKGKYTVLLNGRAVAADISAVDLQGQYAIGIDEQSFAASIEHEGNPTDLHVGIAGNRWHFQVLDERELAASEISAAAGGNAETVKSPMPGLVVDIHVAVGDELEPGAPLLILEAMKMQNEVVSEQGGRVCEVNVEVGQAVENGASMVRLEPIEE